MLVTLEIKKRVNLIIWNNIVRQMLYNNIKNIALHAYTVAFEWCTVKSLYSEELSLLM